MKAADGKNMARAANRKRPAHVSGKFAAVGKDEGSKKTSVGIRHTDRRERGGEITTDSADHIGQGKIIGLSHRQRVGEREETQLLRLEILKIVKVTIPVGLRDTRANPCADMIAATERIAPTTSQRARHRQDAVNTVGREIGKSLVRGLFGTLKK